MRKILILVLLTYAAAGVSATPPRGAPVRKSWGQVRGNLVKLKETAKPKETVKVEEPTVALKAVQVNEMEKTDEARLNDDPPESTTQDPSTTPEAPESTTTEEPETTTTPPEATTTPPEEETEPPPHPHRPHRPPRPPPHRPPQKPHKPHKPLHPINPNPHPHPPPPPPPPPSHGHYPAYYPQAPHQPDYFYPQQPHQPGYYPAQDWYSGGYGIGFGGDLGYPDYSFSGFQPTYELYLPPTPSCPSYGHGIEQGYGHGIGGIGQSYVPSYGHGFGQVYGEQEYVPLRKPPSKRPEYFNGDDDDDDDDDSDEDDAFAFLRNVKDVKFSPDNLQYDPQTQVWLWNGQPSKSGSKKASAKQSLNSMKKH